MAKPYGIFFAWLESWRPRGNLRAAIAALPGVGVRVAKVSSLYETEPVDYLSSRGHFRNAHANAGSAAIAARRFPARRQDSSQAKDIPYGSPSALSIPRKASIHSGHASQQICARHFDFKMDASIGIRSVRPRCCEAEAFRRNGWRRRYCW